MEKYNGVHGEWLWQAAMGSMVIFLVTARKGILSWPFGPESPWARAHIMCPGPYYGPGLILWTQTHIMGPGPYYGPRPIIWTLAHNMGPGP